MRYLVMIALLALANPLRADEDLDAELDAEWGHQKIQATKIESQEDKYKAQLKLIESIHDDSVERCKARGEGGRYCVKAAEETFRRNKRALDARFEGNVHDQEYKRRKRAGFN